MVKSQSFTAAFAFLALAACSSGFEVGPELTAAKTSFSGSLSDPPATIIDPGASAQIPAPTPFGTVPSVASPTPQPQASSTPAATPSQTQKPVCDFSFMAMSHHETEIRNLAKPDAVVSLEGYSLVPGTRIVTRPAVTENRAVRPMLLTSDCSFQLATLTTTGLCLEAGAGDGATIMQNNCDAGSAFQRFKISTDAANRTSIRSSDGRCMEMQGTANQFLPVVMKTCNGSEAQVFSFGGLTSEVILPTPTVITEPKTQTLSNVSVTLLAAAASSSANIVLYQDARWQSPRPGAYVEYTVMAPYTGHYSFQVTYASWLPGAAMDVSVNGKPAGHVALPSTGSMNSIVETTAFALDFEKGTNTVRFAMPDTLVPYLTMSFASTYTNEKITRPGYVTPVSADSTTTVDLADINRLFRLSLDQTLGRRAWRYPGNFAHAEYKLKIPRAGRYEVEIEYSSPSAGYIDLLLNPVPLVNVGAETPIASIALQSSGPEIGTFATASTIAELPAGEIRLDFFGRLNVFKSAWAISGIKITPR